MSRMPRTMLKYVLICREQFEESSVVTEITRFSSRGNFLTDANRPEIRNITK